MGLCVQAIRSCHTHADDDGHHCADRDAERGDGNSRSRGMMRDRISFMRYCLRFWRPLLTDLWMTLCEWRRQRAMALRYGWRIWRVQ